MEGERGKKKKDKLKGAKSYS